MSQTLTTVQPMIWAMYWLNYLDRNAITLARLDDMEGDLGITETRESKLCRWRKVVCQLTTLRISDLCEHSLRRLHSRTGPFQHAPYPRTTLLVHGILDGPVGYCLRPHRSGKGLQRSSSHTFLPWHYGSAILREYYVRLINALADIVCRVQPGALYILSIFYTRKELATRISILYTGNILATAFAGLIAIGVYTGMGGNSDIREQNEELGLGLTEAQINDERAGVAGLTGWQWLFVLQGIVTFVVAVMGAFILPDFPLTTKWLSPEQRKLAHERIERDTVDLQEKGTTWQGLTQALKDYRVWLFCFMQYAAHEPLPMSKTLR